jgi:glycosyltransferase involved in cell wall biosynthesis
MLSFVIPAFNEESLIVRCIQSVICEAGNITYEIIVADNNSTDNTVELARLAGARVISESRKGVTRARQAGFEACKYDIVAFIDADNDLPPGWLDFALAALKGPDVVAASGPLIYCEMPLHKRMLTFLFYSVGKVAHQFWPMLQGGNFILRKQALQRAGGFNTEIDFYGEDTDTAVRLSKVGRLHFDLDMWVYTSARRMDAEGLFVTGAKYIANYVWIWLFGRPWSTEYRDHRPD